MVKTEHYHLPLNDLYRSGYEAGLRAGRDQGGRQVLELANQARKQDRAQWLLLLQEAESRASRLERELAELRARTESR